MLKKVIAFFLLVPNLAIGQISDADISTKLSQVQSEVPLYYTPLCKPFVQEYISNYANRTGKMLERFNGLDDELKAVFITNNVPIELRFACISFSNCDNAFTDKSGKEGAFMLDFIVAQNNGLYISNYVDERRDPLKAASVFCKEINSIYSKTADWRIALTQYASGQLEWQKAVLKTSDSVPDFSIISSNLPYQFRTVYPRYLAAVYIANYYKNHHIAGNGLLLKKEEVPIRKYTTLYHLANELDIDQNLMRELNPIYKKGIVPNSGRDYFVVLPTKKVNRFYELGEEVYNSPLQKSTPLVDVESNQQETKGSTVPAISQEKELEKKVVSSPPKKEVVGDRTIIYQVRKGDAISVIADYYDCYVSDIKRWNRLRSTRINYGQRLKIVIPASKYDYYIRINKMSSAELSRIRNND